MCQNGENYYNLVIIIMIAMIADSLSRRRCNSLLPPPTTYSPNSFPFVNSIDRHKERPNTCKVCDASTQTFSELRDYLYLLTPLPPSLVTTPSGSIDELNKSELSI